MSGCYEVRPARLVDAEAIAAVHVASWREAYAHVLSAGFLEGLDVEARRAMWRRALESADRVWPGRAAGSRSRGRTSPRSASSADLPYRQFVIKDDAS